MLYDRFLLWLVLGLVCIGFLAISSGSLSIGLYLMNDSCYFIKRVIFYYSVAFILSWVILKTPIIVWRNYSVLILLFSLCMLIIVLICNNTINGASRWIMWGSLCMQPSELSKLSFIIYLSAYLERRTKEVCSSFWGMCKPILIMIFLAFLLLGQPDFGGIIILFIITFFILFLFGVNFWKLILIFLFNIFLIIFLVMFKSYRVQRILAFLDPWSTPFGHGYQLIQSLIAFGRGRYFGQGIGNSIQKLEYLPESHTDFIFSVLSEELGLFGSCLILLMLFLVVLRAIMIGTNSLKYNKNFLGILAYSIGIWLGIQTFINVGVVSGILPTKGLTLPFISYGGSSFLITIIASTLLIRIDFEMRLSGKQAISRRIYDR